MCVNMCMYMRGLAYVCMYVCTEMCMRMYVCTNVYMWVKVSGQGVPKHFDLQLSNVVEGNDICSRNGFYVCKCVHVCMHVWRCIHICICVCVYVRHYECVFLDESGWAGGLKPLRPATIKRSGTKRYLEADWCMCDDIVCERVNMRT